MNRRDLKLVIPMGADQTARHARVTPRSTLPPCPECRARPSSANTTADHYRDVRHLGDPRSLSAYTLDTTDLNHNSDENDLVAL